MIKKIFILLTILLCNISTGFANEQEIANSFVTFANEQIKPIQESYERKDYFIYFMPHNDFSRQYKQPGDVYKKAGLSNLEAKIDVKKTDSILNPYIGILILSADPIAYYSPDNLEGNYKTKEEAAKANLTKRGVGECIYKFNYIYKNNTWELNKVISYCSSDTGFEAKLQPPSFFFIRKDR